MKHYFKNLFILFSLCFTLNAYAQNTVQFILNGIEGDILKNVQTRLKAEEATFGENLSPADIQTLFANSTNAIKEAIQPYGYINPEIHAKLIHHQTVWQAIYDINLRKPLIIHHLDIQIAGEGKENAALKNYLQHFPLKVGDIFNTENYNKAKEKLFEIGNNQGYIKAEMTENKILIQKQNNEASIIIHFQTGPRYYFGTINFAPNPFDANFLERFILFTPDEPFSSQTLLKLQQDMEGSSYFNQVIITPDFNHIKHYRVPIRIEVKIPKSQKYDIALGYGTFTGPRLSAGVSFRRLTDTGHHFDAQVRLSSVISGLIAKYYIPGRNPLTDKWVIGSNVSVFKPKNVMSRSSTLFGGYETIYYGIKSSFYLNYLIERYRIDDNPTKTSQILYPSVNFTYIKADDLINPTYGTSLGLTLQGSSQQILSSTSFFQAEAKGKFIFSPFSFSKVILRGDFGYTVVHNIDDLPASLLFYAGELNGLRGFPDSSIGPGRYLTIGSVEYQNHIVGNWSGAVFYDVGKASDHLNDPLNKSVGIGVIYQSIIGPVKLYVAHPLNNDGKAVSFQLSIGPEF